MKIVTCRNEEKQGPISKRGPQGANCESVRASYSFLIASLIIRIGSYTCSAMSILVSGHVATRGARGSKGEASRGARLSEASRVPVTRNYAATLRYTLFASNFPRTRKHPCPRTLIRGPREVTFRPLRSPLPTKHRSINSNTKVIFRIIGEGRIPGHLLSDTL